MPNLVNFAGVYVSNRLGCSQEYNKIIHIWRDDYLENNCQYVNNSNKVNDNKNLCINYKDGYELREEILQEIYNFVKDSNNILVHCHAGKTRSPIIALFVFAIVNKKHPLSLLNYFYSTYYNTLGNLPNIIICPLEDIIKFYNNKVQYE